MLKAKIGLNKLNSGEILNNLKPSEINFEEYESSENESEIIENEFESSENESEIMENEFESSENEIEAMENKLKSFKNKSFVKKFESFEMTFDSSENESETSENESMWRVRLERLSDKTIAKYVSKNDDIEEKIMESDNDFEQFEAPNAKRPRFENAEIEAPKVKRQRLDFENDEEIMDYDSDGQQVMTPKVEIASPKVGITTPKIQSKSPSIENHTPKAGTSKSVVVTMAEISTPNVKSKNRFEQIEFWRNSQ